MYLDVASKEEDGVQKRRQRHDHHRRSNISPRQSPRPRHPNTAADPARRRQDPRHLGWEQRRSRTPTSDLPQGRRGDHRGVSTTHRLLATRVAKEGGLQHQQAPPAARDRAVLTSQRPPPQMPGLPPGKNTGRRRPDPGPLQREQIGAGGARRAPAPAPASLTRSSSSYNRTGSREPKSPPPPSSAPRPLTGGVSRGDEGGREEGRERRWLS